MAHPKQRLMLATTNPGKAAELRELLALHLDPAALDLLTLRDWPTPLPDVEEVGATFAENARLKASALAQATRLPALADDSGLCVAALDGAPGLYSARWAGEGATDTDRNTRLLALLEDVPEEQRTARFVSAVALALPGGEVWTAEGVCAGRIGRAPRGTGGFGYDPLFSLPEAGLTMAELPPGEKNRRSHRARAIASLAPDLRRLFPAV